MRRLYCRLYSLCIRPILSAESLNGNIVTIRIHPVHVERVHAKHTASAVKETVSSPGRCKQEDLSVWLAFVKRAEGSFSITSNAKLSSLDGVVDCIGGSFGNLPEAESDCIKETQTDI